MKQVTTNNQRKASLWRRVALTTVVALAVAAGVTAGVGHSTTSQKTPEAVAMPAPPTGAELEQWRQATATPFQRGAIVEKMNAAFSGVAEVGAGAMPDPTTVTSATANAHVATEVLALGITHDRFYIIASYGDIARGAISGAVGVCIAYDVPAWLCRSAGHLLTTWSNGWGSANNHGVWAAIYWWPPHVSGGRY